MIDFEKTASDPKRLFQASFRLIEEEKWRNTCLPHLLQLDRQLIKAIEEFERLAGKPVMIGERRYLDTLLDEIADREANQTFFGFLNSEPVDRPISKRVKSRPASVGSLGSIFTSSNNNNKKAQQQPLHQLKARAVSAIITSSTANAAANNNSSNNNNITGPPKKIKPSQSMPLSKKMQKKNSTSGSSNRKNSGSIIPSTSSTSKNINSSNDNVTTPPALDEQEEEEDQVEEARRDQEEEEQKTTTMIPKDLYSTTAYINSNITLTKAFNTTNNRPHRKSSSMASMIPIASRTALTTTKSV